MHLWLVTNRLKQEVVTNKDLQSQHLIRLLDTRFDENLESNMHKLFLKKGKKDFINDTMFFMTSARMIMDKHFNANPKSSRNPLFKLDALVWTKVFTEKIERYSPEVYKVAAYLLAQH